MDSMATNNITKRLTSEQIEDLADRIYKLFKKNDMWSDTFIYFNGCRIGNKDTNGNYHYDGTVYMEQDKNPEDYFEYVNPDHILSMSFEGPVYHMFNYGSYPDVLKKFNKLINKFGPYYEFGHAWNLTCYYL